MVRRRWYLLACAACAALAAALYLVVVHVGAAQRLDVRILEHAMARQTPDRDAFAEKVVSLFDPLPFVLLSCAVVAIGLALKRPRAAISAALLLAAANATTELLKPALAVQRAFPPGHYLGPAAYPSGHTTAIVSFALALVIVLPAALRIPAALLGTVGVLVGVASILVLGFHYPSDAVGGALVASGWAAAAVAVTGSDLVATAARRRPRPHSLRAPG